MSIAEVIEAESEIEETALTTYEGGAVAALNKSEVEAQLDAAHKYRRSIQRFRQEALSMATLSEEIAQSCIYSLPRGGKPITGPSIRLAEICASAWGNIHVGARPVEVGETEVTSQGVAWDLERNVRVTVESKRRITTKDGKRFNDDMIIVTQNAANSIALRNAIFRVIPRAYVDLIYDQVRKVAVGNASTLSGKRATVLERLGKMGADQDRVLSALGKAGVDDIGLEELEILIGYGTAIKEGTKTVDELFPEVAKDVPGAAAGEQGRRISLKGTAAKASAAITPPGPLKPGETVADAAETTAKEIEAATSKPADAQQPPVEFVMPTPKARKALINACSEARIALADVMKKLGKPASATIEDMSADEVAKGMEIVQSVTGEVPEPGSDG